LDRSHRGLGLAPVTRSNMNTCMNLSIHCALSRLIVDTERYLITSTLTMFQSSSISQHLATQCGRLGYSGAASGPPSTTRLQGLRQSAQQQEPATGAFAANLRNNHGASRSIISQPSRPSHKHQLCLLAATPRHRTSGATRAAQLTLLAKMDSITSSSAIWTRARRNYPWSRT
jgi:hypothetical protein